MQERDLNQVLCIEQAAYHYPWSRGIFMDCLSAGYSCQIYRQEGTPLAYSVVAYMPDEAHLLNLCVEPGEQGRGLAKILLHEAEKTCLRHDIQSMLLEVRKSNHRAVSLYLKDGFNEIGVRRKYYPARKGREDALILAKELFCQ